MLPVRVNTDVPRQRSGHSGDRVRNPFSWGRQRIPPVPQVKDTRPRGAPNGLKEIARCLDDAERAHRQADAEDALDTGQQLSERKAVEPKLTVKTAVQRRRRSSVGRMTLDHHFANHSQQQLPLARRNCRFDWAHHGPSRRRRAGCQALGRLAGARWLPTHSWVSPAVAGLGEPSHPFGGTDPALSAAASRGC